MKHLYLVDLSVRIGDDVLMFEQKLEAGSWAQAAWRARHHLFTALERRILKRDIVLHGVYIDTVSLNLLTVT